MMFFPVQLFQAAPCVLAAVSFLLFTQLPMGECTANLRQVEKRILDDIIGEGRYDSRIRPSGQNQTMGKDGPANVTINLLLRSISSIDDVTMTVTVVCRIDFPGAPNGAGDCLDGPTLSFNIYTLQCCGELFVKEAMCKSRHLFLVPFLLICTAI